MGYPRFPRAAALLCALTFVPSAPSSAQILGNTVNDNTQAELNAAILQANQTGETIEFGVGVMPNDVFPIVGSLLQIENDVTFDGTTPQGLVFDGTLGNPILVLDPTRDDDVQLVDITLRNGGVTFGDDNRFVYEVTGSNTISVDVPFGGAGGPVTGIFVKDGAGTLVFTHTTATSDYGLTRVDDGILRSTLAGIPGDVNIRADARFVFDLAADGTYANTIDGDGVFEKDGLGSLEITGLLGAGGGTLVSRGTLVLSGDLVGVGAASMEVASGARLDWQIGAPRLIFLDGAGTFVKAAGTPTLSLFGGQFTGLLDVDGGDVTDLGAVLQGTVDLAAGTNLSFQNAFVLEATVAASIQGDGSVTVSGNKHIFTGANTYTGGTTVLFGALQGSTQSLQGTIFTGPPPPSPLFQPFVIFEQPLGLPNDGAFNGTITGGGAVQTFGPGTVTFDTTQTYLGPTSVVSGRLNVDDTLVSEVVVFPGATLGGDTAGATGIIGPVVVNGRIAPGHEAAGAEFGRLQMIQSLALESGSVFEVDISEAAIDLVSVENGTGTATIDGTIIDIRAAPGDYTAPQPLRDILRADGGITIVNPPTLDRDFAFLDETLNILPNALQLSIENNGTTISSFASTQNQRATGVALEQAGVGATGDMALVFENIQVIEVAEVPLLLDSMSPEIVGGFTTSRRALGMNMNRTLHRRARDSAWGHTEGLFGGSSRPAPLSLRRIPGHSVLALAPAPRAVARAASDPVLTFERQPGESGIGAWLEGFGILGDLSGDGNSSDLDYKLMGGSLGVDYRFDDHWLAGIAGGYAYTELDLSQLSSSSGSSNTGQLALYGGYVDPLYYATASGRFAYGSNESERQISFQQIDRTAKGSFSTIDYGMRVEAGFTGLVAGGFSLTPAAAFDWSQLTQPSFTETGAGSLNLEVESFDSQSLLTSLGARMAWMLQIDRTTRFSPEARLFWLHEFGDTDRIVSSSISGALNGGSFRVVGAEVPRDTLLAGIGLSASVGENATVFGGYDARFGQDLLEHDVTVALRVAF